MLLVIVRVLLWGLYDQATHHNLTMLYLQTSQKTRTALGIGTEMLTVACTDFMKLGSTPFLLQVFNPYQARQHESI